MSLLTKEYIPIGRGSLLLRIEDLTLVVIQSSLQEGKIASTLLLLSMFNNKVLPQQVSNDRRHESIFGASCPDHLRHESLLGASSLDHLMHQFFLGASNLDHLRHQFFLGASSPDHLRHESLLGARQVAQILLRQEEQRHEHQMTFDLAEDLVGLLWAYFVERHFLLVFPELVVGLDLVRGDTVKHLEEERVFIGLNSCQPNNILCNIYSAKFPTYLSLFFTVFILIKNKNIYQYKSTDGNMTRDPPYITIIRLLVLPLGTCS